MTIGVVKELDNVLLESNPDLVSVYGSIITI